MMRSWLGPLPEDPRMRLYFVEYDGEPFFEDFMRFKEERLMNREIPYVRYYRAGMYARCSNYLDKKSFLSLLLGPGAAEGPGH